MVKGGLVMSIYKTYKKLITLKIERESITEEFITKTTTQLDYYLKKKKLTKTEYDELITLLNNNIDG